MAAARFEGVRGLDALRRPAYVLIGIA